MPITGRSGGADEADAGAGPGAAGDGAGGGRWEGPGLDAWHAWTPGEVAERLAGVDVPWCVVGGWAIDLFVGHETRPHADLEIAVLRPDLPRIRRALAGYRFHAVGEGEVRALADGEEPPAGRHQNWVLDPDVHAWRVDVMLEPGDATTWVFRRDPTVRAPRADMMGHTAEGIPFLRPHGALLYKAKAVRPKDEHDLATCLPRLPAPERAWLAAALARVHPGHPWLTLD
jgi:hypothetical protein